MSRASKSIRSIVSQSRASERDLKKAPSS